MVVVRAAARRVHGRGRHGVEREHELLSVAHAGRLGMVPRNACEEEDDAQISGSTFIADSQIYNILPEINQN